MAAELILVVEDDAHLAELLRLTLSRTGFDAAVASDGEKGLSMWRAANPSLIILDLSLPGIDGLEICREIRRESRIPIIMLTGRGEELDRVIGLETGADDYMVKPFSPLELVARIHAVLRRTGASAPRRLEFPNLLIDLDRREALVAGQVVPLTPKEFDLLAALAGQPGKVLSREDLLKQVWGYDYPGEGRTVDEHMRRLRLKVESQAPPYRYFRTVWGVGYAFEVMV